MPRIELTRSGPKPKHGNVETVDAVFYEVRIQERLGVQLNARQALYHLREGSTELAVFFNHTFYELCLVNERLKGGESRPPQDCSV